MEADLVQRARRGDRDAQEDLVLLHRQPAYLLALQLTGNPDDALDVAQDAMIRFLTTLHRFDERRAVRPWLFQIVRNRVLDLRRRQRVRRHDSLDDVREDRPRLEIIDRKANPEQDAEKSQLRQRLWEAVQEMPEHHREIIVLRDYQDLSYAEIASTLDIPLGTVMSRLHGARKRLRKKLQRELDSVARKGAGRKRSA